MRPRTAIAIEIGRRRIRALAAVRARGRLSVSRTLVERVPESIDADDPAVLGAWLGERLRASGFAGRGRVTVALGRDHVGMKRLALPTTEDDELPEMTRLALQRELPFDARDAVIDYVVVERGAAGITVMAVAAPSAVLDWTRRTVEAAGLRIDRIGLRAMGCAALLAEEAGASCVLAIDVAEGGVEFSVVAGGVVRFSRAAETAAPPAAADGTRPAEADGDDAAGAVVTETRRTWLSYRMTEGATDVERAVIMSDSEAVERAAPAIAEMLGVPAEVLRRHPRVEARRGGVERVWPLAGVLLEPLLKRERIDFARPRQPVDRGTRLRHRLIAAAAAAAFLILAAWTVSNRTLRSLDRRIETLSARRTDLAPGYARYTRDLLKLEHLRQWERADVGWFDQASFLYELTPPPDAVVLDSWAGTLDFRGVRCDTKHRPLAWSAPASLTIVLDGEARDRPTADAFRETLVDLDRYTVQSSGADARSGRRLPYGFTYRLVTDVESTGTAAQTDTGADSAQEPTRVGRVEPGRARNSEDRPGRGDRSAQTSFGRVEPEGARNSEDRPGRGDRSAQDSHATAPTPTPPPNGAAP